MKQSLQGLQKYLESSNLSKRLEVLDRNYKSKSWLPVAESKQLLLLDLDEREQTAIIRCCHDDDNLNLEEFLTSQFTTRSQSVASIAIREWAARTEGLLWHRCLPLSNNPKIPQRIAYTLIDVAWTGPGHNYIQKLTSLNSLEDMSSAFLSLLYYRCLQWSYKSDKLTRIAKLRLNRSAQNSLGSEPAIPYFISYLNRFPQKEKIRVGVNNSLICGMIFISQCSAQSPTLNDKANCSNLWRIPN